MSCQILITWSTVLENLIVTHLVKKFHTFNGNRRFIIVFTRAHCVDIQSLRLILPASHVKNGSCCDILLSCLTPICAYKGQVASSHLIFTEQVGFGGNSYDIFGRCPVRILANIPISLTEGFYGVP
jgi:hypothetical protein